METPEKKKTKWYENKWIVGFLCFIVLCVAISVYGSPTNPVPTTQVQGTNLSQTNSQALPPSPSSVFHTYLSYGSSGTAVSSVQQFLADEGLYSGANSGYYDQATTNAVTAFENQENIYPANGTFGYQEEARANAIIANHPDWVTYLSNSNGYSNVNGSSVHSPSYSSNGIPAGASAVCGDGTYSFSMHHSGTCSHHGGVSQWLQ